MPVSKIRRGAKSGKVGFPNANDVRIDPSTDTFRFGTGTSGTTEKVALDNTTSGQAIVSPAISNPTITGIKQGNAAVGAAGAVTEIVVTKVLVDNTLTDFATVTVPNSIAFAGITVEVVSGLGDGDSAQMSIWNQAVARIAGAAAAVTTSAVGVSATKAGATANAVVTVAASAIAGAVGAVNTFTVQIKNARSAGAAAGHPTTAIIRLINPAAAGVSIVAA